MRYIKDEVIDIIDKKKKRAFIAGPRQLGNTTFVQHLLKEVSVQDGYYNWDIETHRQKIIKDPLHFWVNSPMPSRIVLDEIHKYPRWKRLLKGFYDENKGKTEILVTGSGRLDVYQRGGDSLFGRYHLFHLFPYSVGEMENKNICPPSPKDCIQKIFDHPKETHAFESLWKLNGFPEPLFAGTEKELIQWQNDHRQLILKEDMRDLTQIRELGLVEMLTGLLPERVGSPLSINALRETLNVNFNSVKNWLMVLDRLYYLFLVSPYSGKLSRALRREQKVYFYDWAELEDESKRLENLVAVHLKKACAFWTDAGYGTFDLRFVRDKEKREVDFLICDKNKPFILVECKISLKDIDPSLIYFKERLKPTYSFQVGTSFEKDYLAEKKEGIYLCHAARFLAALP